MKRQITVISFTEQGYRLAVKIRDVVQAEGAFAKMQELNGEDFCDAADYMLPEAQDMLRREDGHEREWKCDCGKTGIEPRIEKNVCVVLYRKGKAAGENCTDAIPVTVSLSDWCAEIFPRSQAIIFVGAAGIAVRTIAPFLVSKTIDPAVLVADEQGKHIISLLSGHLGGGNALTLRLAAALGSDPVITTASDVNEKLAIDVWAQKNDLYITDLHAAKEVAAQIVSGASVPFYCEGRVLGEIPSELARMKLCGKRCLTDKITSEPALSQNREENDSENETVREIAQIIADETECSGSSKKIAVLVSVHDPAWFFPEISSSLHLVPRAVILGIGCKKGKAPEEIHAFVFRVLQEYGVVPQSICALASIDLKAEEAGLNGLADELGVPFLTFSARKLQAVPGNFSSSGFVSSVTGVDNVCERAAMAVLTEEEQKTARFLCRKTAGSGVTVALLERSWEVSF